MKYDDYQKKIEKISDVLKKNDKLVTTNRKGHNHRDLNFKKNYNYFLNLVLTNDKEIKREILTDFRR